MSYFADLTPYCYVGAEEENTFNVGWLDVAHQYPTGPTPPEFVEKLAWLCLNGRVNQTRGFYVCDMCESVEWGFYSVVLYGKKHALGSAEIRVSGSHGTYAAPDLILHYVVEHRYLPPEDFVQGILNLDKRFSDEWSLVRGPYWDAV